MSSPSLSPPEVAKRRNLSRHWARKIFSFPVMCMFLLAAVIFGKAPQGIGVGEPDIWWRLRSAADFVSNPSFSSVDMYSFTAAGSSWTNFEWLSDLMFYGAFRTMELTGILLLYALAMVVIFAGVYYRSWRAGANWKNAAIATLGGMCIAVVSLAPRPVLFGWVCLTGLLLVLDRFRRTGKGLWILPPLFVLWINLHGSWIYGMAVLAITIACGLVSGRWGMVISSRWSCEELKKLLVASAAAVAALFVNPYGYKLVIFPIVYFRMRGFMKYNEYWLPVDFSTKTGALAMAFVFVVIAAAMFSRRRWRLDEVVLMAFALWSGLSHVRFLDFTAIICVPILAPRLQLFPPYEPELDKHWLNALIMVGVVGGVVWLLPSEKQLQQKVESEYPVAALAYMKSEHINGRTLSPAEFGGFIEWTTPEIKSFADGRTIFVEKGIFEDSMRALTISEPFEILDRYEVQYVLTEPTWPLADILQRSPEWRSIYSDKVAVVFERIPNPGGGAEGTRAPSH